MRRITQLLSKMASASAISFRDFLREKKPEYRQKFPFLRENQIAAKIKKVWNAMDGRKPKTSVSAAHQDQHGFRLCEPQSNGHGDNDNTTVINENTPPIPLSPPPPTHQVSRGLHNKASVFDFGSRSPAVDCSPDKLPTSLLAAMPTVPAGREGEGSSPMTNSLSRRPLKAIKYSSSSANHKQSKDDAAKTKCVNFSDTVVVNSTEAAGNEPAASELQQSEGSVVTNTDQLCSGVPLIPTPPPPVRDVWDDPPSPGGGLCGNPVVPETELSDANRPSLSTTLPGMPNLQSAPPNLDDDLPSSKEAEIDIPLSMSTSSRPCSVQLNVQPSSGTPNQSSSNDNTQQSQVDHLQPPRKRKAGQKGKAVRKKRNSRPKQSKQSSPPPGPASNKENSDQKMVKRSRTKRAIDCVATTPTRVTRSMAAALGQKSALLHEGSAELVTTASTATTTGSEEEGETLDEVAEPDSKIPRIERESEVKDPGLSVASSTDYNALTTTVTPRVAVGQLSLPHSEICDHDDFKPITKQSEEETCTLANEVEKLPAVPSSKLASSLSSSSSADTMAIAATKNTSCELPLRTDSLCDATGNRALPLENLMCDMFAPLAPKLQSNDDAVFPSASGSPSTSNKRVFRSATDKGDSNFHTMFTDEDIFL